MTTFQNYMVKRLMTSMIILHYEIYIGNYLKTNLMMHTMQWPIPQLV